MKDRVKESRPFLRGALVCACAVAAAGCQTTTGHRIEHARVEVVTPDGRVEVAFSQDDERCVRDYYRGRGPKEGAPNWGPPGRGRGHGRGKKPGGLPPGIERRLERGKPIPPGLQRGRLPRELEERLGRLPEGYVHLRVGGSIVIEHVRMGVVVDIIHDIGG